MDKISFMYSNMVNFTMSNHDIQFSFFTKGSINNELVDFCDPVIITMSPTHAKVFSIILQKNIEAYEKEFGELKVIIPNTEKEM